MTSHKTQLATALLAAMAFAAGTVQAATPVVSVAYASLSGPVVGFEELALGSNPDGTLIEGVLASGGVLFGERFAGQELSLAKAPRPGEVAQDWFDDLSYGAPTSGLTLLAGASGANLGVYDYGDADGKALAGVGPQNSDSSDPFGFGAISARLATPVAGLGLQIRDGNGGSAWLNLYRIDGSLIQSVELQNLQDGLYGWARSDGTADIAGWSLFNQDSYYGVAIDRVLLASAVPEPGPATLLATGLLVGVLLARRRSTDTSSTR